MLQSHPCNAPAALEKRYKDVEGAQRYLTYILETMIADAARQVGVQMSLTVKSCKNDGN